MQGRREFAGFERLLGMERDLLAGLVAFGAAVAPQDAAVRDVRVDGVPEPDANRIALGLQLGSSGAKLVPGVWFHPDLIPQVFAVEAGEADVVVGKSGPGIGALVVCVVK